MPAPLRFVIVSLPRTGSTYLVDYLDAVDGVRCLSEIFHPNAILLRHHKPTDPALDDIRLRDADQAGYLQRIVQEVGDCRCFGFKHFPRHGVPLLEQLCSSREWRKIYLWRENLLEQYLSFLLASAHFGGGSWGRVPGQIRMTVPLEMLLDDLHAMQRNYFILEKVLLRAHPDDLFTLEYDELGEAAVIRRLLQFLHLPEAVVDETLAGAGRRAPSDDLRFARGPTPAERIQNYDEVRTMLGSSRYRRWVEA